MKPEIYRYYSTQRPVDIGTYPKSAGEPISIFNYHERKRIEPWGFRALGYLDFSAPLDARHAEDYELRPSPENPDVKQKMYEQAQVVGKYEQRYRIRDNKRLTWWYPDFGSFVLKEFVTPETLEARYKIITGEVS